MLGCLSGARYEAGFERNSGAVPGDSIPAAFWEPVKVFVLIDVALGNCSWWELENQEAVESRNWEELVSSEPSAERGGSGLVPSSARQDLDLPTAPCQPLTCKRTMAISEVSKHFKV